MPLQSPAHPTPKQKYSAARAFYLTILVISAIAALSLITQRRDGRGSASRNNLLLPRANATTLATEDALFNGTAGNLVPRDEAVLIIRSEPFYMILILVS